MLELKERNCIPTNEIEKALEEEEINKLKKKLATSWKIESKRILKKDFLFDSYKRAMAFVQEVALIAEGENHHPDICIKYTTVEISLITHDLGGLTVNDFIMAAKIEDL